MRHRRIVLIASLLASGLVLSGCESFDPTEWFNTKKPLPGDRKEMFPGGVPGVPQGVPPELVQGYNPPPEPVPEPLPMEKPKAKPKPKPKAEPKPREAAAPRTSITVAPSPQGGAQAPWPNSQPAPAQSQSPFPDPPRR
jgi:hypothetical protein